MSIERPGGKGGFFIYNLNPRVAVPCFCGGPQGRPCKKQTAFLLRLANFPGGRRSALVKIGALRQRRLPVSSTGRGRRRCPCSASLYLPQAALGCAAHRPFSGVSSPWLRSLGRGWHGYTKQSRAQQANASRNVNPRDSPGSAWSFIFVRTAQENPIHSRPEIPYNGARGEIA